MKQETIAIESPEKIHFHYKTAKIGTRIGAYILDLLIQFVILLLVVTIVAIGSSGLFSIRSAGGFQMLAVSFLYLVYFFLQWGYFTFFEMFKNGQSPGKKAMRLHVIRADGEPLNAASIVLRNLMRSVDGLPAFHFLGGLVCMLDKKNRRLGDMIADTVVVHEISFHLEEPDFETKLSEAGTDQPAMDLLIRLNEEELYVIRRFLGHRHQLSEKRQEEVAEKLALRVKKRLKIHAVFKKNNDIAFLEAVYREHAHEDA